MTRRAVPCPSCRTDWLGALNPSCIDCTIWGSTLDHWRREKRRRWDWEGVGVAVFGALCGGTALGIVGWG